jgi:hypothetical protein
MLSRKWMAGAVFALALLFLDLPALAKDKTAESLWTVGPMAIDGLAEEWSGATFLAQDSAGADLAFRNDADYLYALLVVKDKQHLSSFNATGIFVFFNTEGKKNKDRKLHFYVKMATAQELIQALEKSGQILTDEKKAELLSRKSYILYNCELVEGKKVFPIDPALTSQPWPPIFKAHMDGERTVFEFRFPLSRENQASGIGASPGGNLKVGFEWGGLTEQMKARRLEGMRATSERNPNADAPKDYVDRGPQTQTNISSQMRSAPPKKFSFWLDLKLAGAQ